MDDLQYPLGGKQEVNEAAEAVSSVLPFHHTEELPQDGGSGDTEGPVQGRQGALDTVVQRLSVLRGKQEMDYVGYLSSDETCAKYVTGTRRLKATSKV